MKLVNLTPHEIIVHASGSTLKLPPSGQVARVAETREDLGVITIDGLQVAISRATYGQVEGLPEPAPDTLLIVSGLVLAAVGGKRSDIVAPGPAIRDAEGKVIGCTGLSAGPAYKVPAENTTGDEDEDNADPFAEVRARIASAVQRLAEQTEPRPNWETVTEMVERTSTNGRWSFAVSLSGCQRRADDKRVVRGEAEVVSRHSAIIRAGEKLYFLGGDAEVYLGNGKVLLSVDLQSYNTASLLEIVPGDIVAEFGYKRRSMKLWRVSEDGKLAPVVGVEYDQARTEHRLQFLKASFNAERPRQLRYGTSFVRGSLFSHEGEERRAETPDQLIEWMKQVAPLADWYFVAW